jgi:hypothetical protein
MWGNWVMRVQASGVAAGVLQATLPAGGPTAGPVEVAWVVVRAAQGRGYGYLMNGVSGGWVSMSRRPGTGRRR